MKIKVIPIVLLILGCGLILFGLYNSNNQVKAPNQNDEIKEELNLEIAITKFIMEEAENKETTIKFVLYNLGEVAIPNDASDELYIKFYNGDNLLETFPYVIKGLGVGDEQFVETVRPIDFSKITRYEIFYLDKTVEIVKEENIIEKND